MKKYILILICTIVLSFSVSGIVSAQLLNDPTPWIPKDTIKNKGTNNSGGSNTINTDPKTGLGSNTINTDPKTGLGSNTMNTNSSSGTTTAGDIPKIDDPIPGEITVEELLLKLFDIVLYIAIPLVAFFMIYSGFMFVSAQGNAEAIETAKKRLGWTIFGAVILLGAWTISQAIKGTIDDIKNGGKTSYLEKYTLS